MDRDPVTADGVVTQKGNGQAKSAKRNTPKKANLTSNMTTQNEYERVSGSTKSVSSSTRKKPVAAIIAAVVAVLLILAGIGFAVWFFVIHNNPDKIMLDAVNSVLTSDNLVADGTVQVEFPANGESSIDYIVVEFDSSSQRLPNSANVRLNIYVDNDNQFQFDLGTVQLRDSVAYLRISGIVALLDQIEDDEIYEEMADFFDLMEVIDGEWWRISVPEITDYLQLGSTGEAYNELYTCTVDLMAQDQSSELRKLYQSHKFLTLTKSSDQALATAGSTVYEAQINHENLAQFINGLFETQFAEQYYGCYNTALSRLGANSKLSAEDFNEVTSEEISEFLPQDLALKLEISNWSHELRSVNIENVKIANYEVNGLVKLNREATVVIEPEDYRPITDLLEEILEWIMVLPSGSGEDE